MKEGLAYLETFSTNEKLALPRLKYTAKLKELMAHLHCEPLWFPKAVECIGEAEKIYEENKLGENLKTRFLIKKASLLKKCGYFHQSLKELN